MKIKKYNIIKLIGKGGMGQVFLAVDATTQKPYAIKEIICDNSNDPEQLKRFRQEYKLISSLKHPNIVKAYDFIEEQQKFFIVMEYIEGVPLDTFISNNNGKLALKDKIAIAVQIARAIEAINLAGIVHRDIKPSNIMVDERNKQIKVLDLGMGKYIDVYRQDKLTKTGVVLGTPQYMSPEQINGKLESNSDVFSLATTLYQFFANESDSPFSAENLTETIVNISTKRLPSLVDKIEITDSTERNVYRQISVVLDEALTKDFTERTKSCQVLSEQLSHIYYQFRSQRSNGKSWRISTTSKKSLSDFKATSRYRNQYKKQNTNQSTMFFLLGLFAVIFLIVLKYSQEQTPIPKEQIPTVVQTTLDVATTISKARELILQKKYMESALLLDTLDKEKLLPLTQGSDDVSKYIYLFYANDWKQAHFLTPKLLQRKDDPIAWFYAIRLLIYLGEFSLAHWYGNILYFEHPEFCDSLLHPAIDVATKKGFDAYQKLKKIDIIEAQKQEYIINEIFLRISFHLSGVSFHTWKKTSELVEKHITNEHFQKIYKFILLDTSISDENQKWVKIAEIFNSKELLDCHYIQHRSSCVLFRADTLDNIKVNMTQFIQDYPLFYPSQLLVSSNRNVVNQIAKYNTLGSNNTEVKDTLYCCAKGIIHKEAYIEDFLFYTELLMKYRSNWYYSYSYYTKKLLYQNKPVDAFFCICDGIKINAARFIPKDNVSLQGYSKWLVSIFTVVPSNQKMHILVDLEWYILQLSKRIDDDAIKELPFFSDIQDNFYKIKIFRQCIPATIEDTYFDHLAQKEYLSQDEAEALAKYYFVKGDSNKAKKIIEKEKLPFLEAIYILDNSKTSKNILEQVETSFKKYKQFRGAERLYDILFCLENYRLAMLYKEIGEYQKTIDIITGNPGGFINFNNEANKINLQYLDNKFIIGVADIDCYLIRANLYIDEKNFVLAKRDADYISFLISVSADYQEDKAKLSLLLKRIDEASSK